MVIFHLNLFGGGRRGKAKTLMCIPSPAHSVKALAMIDMNNYITALQHSVIKKKS